MRSFARLRVLLSPPRGERASRRGRGASPKGEGEGLSTIALRRRQSLTRSAFGEVGLSPQAGRGVEVTSVSARRRRVARARLVLSSRAVSIAVDANETRRWPSSARPRRAAAPASRSAASSAGAGAAGFPAQTTIASRMLRGRGRSRSTSRGRRRRRTRRRPARPRGAARRRDARSRPSARRARRRRHMRQDRGAQGQDRVRRVRHGEISSTRQTSSRRRRPDRPRS